jgi:hypothetical protein
MSTTDQAVSTGTLSTEKVTYRGFAKFDDKGKISEVNAKAESGQKNEKGEPKNWAIMTEKGYTQLNENEFVRYTVKSEEGFALLVPDEQQRLYIVQAGLNYIQNSKANGFMVELEEDGVTPSSNGKTIDLKEAINEPPSKRSLSPQEKLLKTINSMGLTKEQAIALFQQLAAGLPDTAVAEADPVEAVAATEEAPVA